MPLKRTSEGICDSEDRRHDRGWQMRCRRNSVRKSRISDGWHAQVSQSRYPLRRTSRKAGRQILQELKRHFEGVEAEFTSPFQHTLPSMQDSLLLAPNFFLEVKKPGESAAVAMIITNTQRRSSPVVTEVWGNAYRWDNSEVWATLTRCRGYGWWRRGGNRWRRDRGNGR